MGEPPGSFAPFDGQIKRRKSLFRRIADSISSYVPSSIFPQTGLNQPSSYSYEDNPRIERSTEQTSERAASHLRDSDTQTFPAYPRCTVDVDLDAADNSDVDLSAHSSTSGVSSLLPRARSGPFSRHVVKSMHPDSPRAPSHQNLRQPASWTNSFNNLGECSKAHSIKRARTESNQSTCSLSESGRNSPFYLSRTTYGGAASCRSLRHHELLKSTIPLRFELETTATSSKSESGSVAGPNLSSAARHILQSLERFSTPLSTVDRVPLPFAAESRRNSVYSSKLPRSQRYPPYLQAYSHLKSVRKRLRASEDQQLDEPPEIVSKVPVSSLASSTLFRPPHQVESSTRSAFANSNQHPNVISTVSTSVDSVVSTAASLDSSISDFTFSSPIRRPPSIASQLALAASTEVAPSKYSFRSPSHRISSSDSLTCGGSSSFTPTVAVSSPIFDLLVSSSTAPEPKVPLAHPTVCGSLPTWRCETCLMDNSSPRETCSGCGSFRPPLPASRSSSIAVSSTSQSTSAPKECNHAYAFGSTQLSTNSGSLGAFKSSNEGRWQCSTCLVFNDSGKPSCVCCGNQAPSARTSVDSSKSDTLQFPASSAVMSSVQWICPTCLVRNSEDKLSCPCCSTRKPGTNAASESNPQTTTNMGGFPSVFGFPAVSSASATGASRWQCPTCLVFNDSCKPSCVCCSTRAPSVKTSTGSSNSGILQSPSSMMSSAASQTPAQWICPTCLVRNSGDKLSCPCCSTQKPGANTASAFSESKPQTTTNMGGFPSVFGFPTVSSASTTGARNFTFNFGNSTSSSTSIAENIPTTTTTSEALSSGLIPPSTSSVSFPTFSFSSTKSTTANPTTSVIPTTQASSGSASTSGVSTPVFTFGSQSPPCKPSCFANGLINGDLPSSKLTSLSQSVSSTASALPNGPFKFSFSTSSSSTTQPFTFGSVPASTGSSPLPVIISSSASIPFLFSAPATVAVPSAFPNPSTVSIFGQSSVTPSGNVFSVASSAPPRKKIHAMRRLQR